jgi:hypothetical protein
MIQLTPAMPRDEDETRCVMLACDVDGIAVWRHKDGKQREVSEV